MFVSEIMSLQYERKLQFGDDMHCFSASVSTIYIESGCTKMVLMLVRGVGIDICE